jgi:hypothetical protein
MEENWGRQLGGIDTRLSVGYVFVSEVVNRVLPLFVALQMAIKRPDDVTQSGKGVELGVVVK